MTEKRFYVDDSGDFNDKQTGNIIVDFGYSLNAMECKMILDLLNDLNNENEQLKSRVEKLETLLHLKTEFERDIKRKRDYTSRVI